MTKAIVAVLVVIGLIWVLASLDGTSVPTAEAMYPEPSNYAVDSAGILSVEQLAELNTKLATMDTDAHQFGVVVVKTTQPLDIEAYSIKLAEKWRVGKEDLDNGAIIVVATEDRKVRIEVGYGLEGDINDAAAGKILDDSMVPLLKQGDWYGAINSGLDALSARVK